MARAIDCIGYHVGSATAVSEGVGAPGHRWHTLYGRSVVFVLVVWLAMGCASSNWFHRGPRPSALVGTWVDSAATTAGDTAVWVLDASGARRTLHITVLRDSTGAVHTRRRDIAEGQWYVDKSSDPSRSSLFCVALHARQGPTCSAFEIDSVANGALGGRRRLVIHSYNPKSSWKRVLIPRDP